MAVDPNYLIVMNGTNTLNIIHAQYILIIKGKSLKSLIKIILKDNQIQQIKTVPNLQLL